MNHPKAPKFSPDMISIAKAKEQKLFYFVMTGVIYRESDGRCLILQRSKSEAAHSGLWGVVGGKLEWADFTPETMTRMNHDVFDWEHMAESLLYRETLEECGLVVGDPKYLASVGYVRPDRVPAICMKFAVKYQSGDVAIAPEFDDFAWVNAQEVSTYQCIEGIASEVTQTIALYQ